MVNKLERIEKKIALNKLEKRSLKEKKKEEITNRHLKYIKKKKRLILFLDILFAFALLNNIGAALVTDYLVVKVAGGGEFYEGNPAQCGEKTGWACATEEQKADGPSVYTIILAQLGIYIVLSGWYLQQRSKVYDYNSMTGLVFLIGVIFLILGYDFAHDFALLMGTWSW